MNHRCKMVHLYRWWMVRMIWRSLSSLMIDYDSWSRIRYLFRHHHLLILHRSNYGLMNLLHIAMLVLAIVILFDVVRSERDWFQAINNSCFPYFTMAATVVKPKIDLIDAENGAQLWIFFSVELLVCPYQYRSHFGFPRGVEKYHHFSPTLWWFNVDCGKSHHSERNFHVLFTCNPYFLVDCLHGLPSFWNQLRTNSRGVQHPFFTVEFPVFLTVFTVESRLFAGRG